MEINEQWDLIAKERFLHRMAGNDISYNNVFLPTIKEYLLNYQDTDILDFGCGTGELTYEIATLGFKTIGIDISKHSIKIAKENFNHKNLTFYDNSLMELNLREMFSLAVANMSLMDTEDLQLNLIEINKCLKKDGKFICIITHPAFWPIYWEYFDEKEFNYLSECSISRTYKTKDKIFNGYKTTHFHRPISGYFEKFKIANFDICNIRELHNNSDLNWYPRFLFFELKKNGL